MRGVLKLHSAGNDNLNANRFVFERVNMKDECTSFENVIDDEILAISN